MPRHFVAVQCSACIHFALLNISSTRSFYSFSLTSRATINLHSPAARGCIYTWGEGRSYQLGTGRHSSRWQPTLVDLVPLSANGATDPIRAIATGAAHMVALSGKRRDSIILSH